MSSIPHNNLLILYGSETGTAQDTAERLWRQATKRGLEARVSAMDDFPITQLLYERLVVFVVATTGQGEPPANMTKSWSFLLRRSLPPNSLSNTWVAVLGLGDSSYAKFNIIAKKLHRRLTDGLGATPLSSVGLADDQHDLGLSAVIDPWSAELWEHVWNKVYPNVSFPSEDPEDSIILRWGLSTFPEATENVPVSGGLPSGGSAYSVKIDSNQRVTPSEHFQEVRVLRMSCVDEGGKFAYSPGDVVYVTPSNPAKSVDKFFDLFEDNGFQRSTRVKLKAVHKGVSVPPQLAGKIFCLENCVQNYWDLNVVPSRSVFEVMASVSEDELEKEKLVELSSPQGTQELFDYCNRPRRTVLEVLADFPHSRARLKLEHMFDLLKPIRPRAFSIASSPLENELLLLVAVVQYRTWLKAPRLGLCSNWLKHLKPAAQFSISIRKGSLRFPSYGMSARIPPIVMVGPGTGVAPFRSFIMTEHLSRTNLRPLMLFFGCRNKAADFFFEKEWEAVETLSVYTAFSRDQPHKIYVQHILAEQKDRLANALIADGGHLFVAGSSKGMPEAVRAAVWKCAVDEGRMSELEADDWLEQMTRENRYQQEVWS